MPHLGIYEGKVLQGLKSRASTDSPGGSGGRIDPGASSRTVRGLCPGVSASETLGIAYIGDSNRRQVEEFDISGKETDERQAQAVHFSG